MKLIPIMKEVNFLISGGKYTFKGFESLGVENTFKLNSFKGKYFYYYGFDNIEPYKYNQYYISQVGSKIIFKHKYNVNEDSLTPIYKNSVYNNFELVEKLRIKFRVSSTFNRYS